MTMNPPLKGVIHGKTIELEREPGLPEGLEVYVTLTPRPKLSQGEGLRNSFGGWAGEDAELDEFLKQMREARHASQRPDLEP